MLIAELIYDAFIFHGVGVSATTAQAAIQVPKAVLHPMIATGTPTPAVTVPKVNPAAA
jgi:hypothetical protein